ncbi:MAG: hypothetical protein ACOYI5_10360, partial [Christensenellales bacterium]
HDIKVFNIEIQKEKEIIFWLTNARISETLAAYLFEQLDLGGEGGGTVFMMPSGAFGLDVPVAIGAREENEAEKKTRSRMTNTAEDLLPALEQRTQAEGDSDQTRH